MMNTGRMVPAIKGDRTVRPWIELWGDWLHRVDVPQCMLLLPLGNMDGVYHVYRFHLGRKFLLSPCDRRPGLLVVITMWPLFLIFDIQLAGLFKYPTFSVGVVGWFTGGAVDLT